MNYTVSEVSDLVNLSKASIYNKLKSMNLEKYITKKQGVTYLNETGLKLIQSSLKGFEEDSKNDLKEAIKDLNCKETDTILNVEVPIDTDYINSLKEDIIYLKDQLKEKDIQLKNQLSVKDIQLHDLNERLKQEQDLNKNNQVLQLRQPQNIKALEYHFQELDTKLLNIREQMQQRKEDQDHRPKGFFKGLFKK